MQPPDNCPGADRCPHLFDERLGSILEALPFGLFILDASGSPVYANEHSTRLLGLGPVMGLKPEELAKAYSAYVAGTNEPYPAEEMPIVRALRGERGCNNDLEVRRVDGSVFLEVEAAPVFDREGKVVYAVAIFRDITATRVMESELRTLVENLELQAIERETRLTEIRTRRTEPGDFLTDVAAALRHAREDARIARNALALFLANFSHELRTPLNHIIGFSDLIDQKISRGVTDDIGRHAANIRQSGSSLLETLNRIIKFAEIETGAHEGPDLEIFMADELLTDLAEWARPLATENGNVLRLVIENPIGSMRSDSSFVRTALRQIVENACKHSRNGKVVIAGERFGDDMDARIRVVVSDEGPGIEPELAKTLLEGRVCPGDPLATGSLGVGIPLAKKLLEAVGGRLTAEPGANGSRFLVELPVLFRLPPGQA